MNNSHRHGEALRLRPHHPKKALEGRDKPNNSHNSKSEIPNPKSYFWHKLSMYCFMQEKNYTGLVPLNKEGRQITAMASEILVSIEAAKEFYNKAKERLLFVHNWGQIAGKFTADFQLTDEQGNEVDRAAKKGDHFRIDIPGPGSKAGGGYDWARVEEIKEVHEADIDSVAILVRPAENPKSSNENVAHFFSGKSTSTFVVTREGMRVTASIYDRNIEANEETEEPLDKIRNSAVGLSAKHGFSKLQWQELVNGLLDKKD
jgi:hypothetical protein